MVTNSFLQLVQQKKNEQDQHSLLAQYEIPLVTVDTAVFAVQNDCLKALLIQRRQEPFEHCWALPGGFIRSGETLEIAASNRLREATHIEDIYLAQLKAFGAPERDPRGRVITVGFYALVSEESLHPVADANAENIGWFEIDNLPPLAFDHLNIVEEAIDRLQSDLEYKPLAFQLLPEMFTLSELQRVYELVLHKELDKRNFRKKILSCGLISETGETKMEGYHRPAQLYRFAKPREISRNN